MKKIVIHKPGDHTELKLEEHAEIELVSEHVRVKVHFSGVNYADICVRWGIYESAKKFIGWPITPGFEFSGVIIETTQTSKFNVGDEVFGVSFFGAYANELVVPEKFVFQRPKNLSREEAAAFPAVFLTAYHALFQNFILREKSTVLVHSAAGGVGSALTQLLIAKKHKVVGVIGSSHKRSYLEELGCQHIIDKSTQDLWQEARKMAPEGFDVVLDANGVETLKESFKHLRPMGKLVVYGFHTMLPKDQKLNFIKLAINYLKTPRFSPLELTSANKSVLAFNLSFLFDHFEILNEGMEELIELVESSKIKGHKVNVFKASEVAKAHGLIESGKSVGKIILEWD